MKEAEWLTSGDPVVLLRHLQGKASERKLRLFACAAWERAWRSHRGWEGQWRPKWEEALAYAEGKPREPFLAAITPEWAVWCLADADPYESASFCASVDLGNMEGCTPVPAAERAALLREVFGNPFRPPVAAGDWRTPDALVLARGIYDEQAFDRLPILGDALEEGGCFDPAVLDHCRAPGLHVRGCWLVDLLLSKG
jgi:hypothetical protein